MAPRRHKKYDDIFFALQHSRSFPKKQIILQMELAAEETQKEEIQPVSKPLLWDNPWQPQGYRQGAGQSARTNAGMRVSIEAAEQNPWQSLLHQQENRKQRRHIHEDHAA